MGIAGTSAVSDRYRLEWDGSVLELEARRAGLRTEVVLLRGGHLVDAGTGTLRVLLPVPPQRGHPTDGPAPSESASPTVLALSVLPGVICQAVLLVPQPARDDERDSTGEGTEPGIDDMPAELPEGVAELAGFAGAERRRFDPPAGTVAARLLALQRKHPRLYASRHVALAVGKVMLGLLGVALFFQLILHNVLGWITERLPRVDWPDITWPDIDLPSIPWPDVDWPDLALPGWLLAVVDTAKYWVPVLIAVGLAGNEAKRRTGKQRDQASPAGPGPSDAGQGSRCDAHR